MRTLVRDNIDEPSSNYWTDAELNRRIADRQRELWTKVYQLKDSYFLSATPATITLAAGTFAYTLPSDFFRALAIRTTTSGLQTITWRRVDPSSPEFLDGLRSDLTVINPVEFMYAIVGNNTLWVSPIPQSVLAARMDYIARTVAVSADTDTFQLPDEFLSWIQYMVTADALAKGPVGDKEYWLARAEAAWQEIMLALDTGRDDQTPDLVRGMYEGP